MRALLPLLLAGALLAEDSDRPFLGINLRELNAEEAAKLKLDVTEGLAVVSTQIGSPARVAGVLPYDIVVALDGVAMKTKDAFRAAMAPHKIGDEVALSLLRKGEKVELKAKLVSRNAWKDEWVLDGHLMPELVVDSWIGDGPKSAKDLQGSVVLLEFWFWK